MHPTSTSSMFSLICFFSCYGDHRDLHSFPTRRSSDLHLHRRHALEAVDEILRVVAVERLRADPVVLLLDRRAVALRDRKSTRLNSSHTVISYAVFCLKKKKKKTRKKTGVT